MPNGSVLVCAPREWLEQLRTRKECSRQAIRPLPIRKLGRRSEPPHVRVCDELPARPDLCVHLSGCRSAYRSGAVFRLCGLDRFCRICRDVDIHSHGCVEFLAENGRIWYSDKGSLYRLQGVSLARRKGESRRFRMMQDRREVYVRTDAVRGPASKCII